MRGGLVRGLRPRARRPTACIWAGYASGRRETDLLRFEAKTEAGTGEAPCVRFASSMFVPRFKFCRAAKKRYKRPHCCLSDATTARESSLIPYTSPKLQNRSSRRRRGSKTASFGREPATDQARYTPQRQRRWPKKRRVEPATTSSRKNGGSRTKRRSHAPAPKSNSAPAESTSTPSTRQSPARLTGRLARRSPSSS